MKNELKPCPFCGGEAKFDEKPKTKISCMDCLCEMTTLAFGPDILIKMWNKRSTTTISKDVEKAFKNFWNSSTEPVTASETFRAGADWGKISYP